MPEMSIRDRIASQQTTRRLLQKKKTAKKQPKEVFYEGQESILTMKNYLPDLKEENKTDDFETC